MDKLLYKELTYQIRAVLFEVYNTLGPGFKEETYKKAVLAELRRRGISAAREVEIEIKFKDEIIDTYRLDILIDNKIILELKAVEALHDRYKAQLISYLKAADMRLGILVNFGADRLQIIRLVH